MMLFAFGKLFSVVLFDIFVNILTHNLAEPAYEADVAQLEYKLVAGEHGLIIRVKGFNHKLPVSTCTVFLIESFKVSYLFVASVAPSIWLAHEMLYLKRTIF